MASLIAAGGLSLGAFGQVGGQFLLQMGVGAGVGIVGGQTILWFTRSIPLPNEGLYPLRTLACALILYGAATLAHGSGFLAVFVAGVVLGDERGPYRREIERFHTALASLAEIVVFIVLGLTVDLHELSRTNVWLPGLMLGAAVAAVIRPALVGLCLLPARLQPNERTFVLFAGLKGAVPILLGGFILAAHVQQASRLYGIIVTAVVFSVLVQGSLIPAVASWLQIPMRATAPEPWAFGIRLAEEPRGVHQFTISAEAPANGRCINDLPDLPEDAWISVVVRESQLLPVSGGTRLRVGDQLLIIADADLHDQLVATFARTA